MRSAHEAVGLLVRRGIELGKSLAELGEEEFEKVAPGIGVKVKTTLGVCNAIKACASYGSTAPTEVDRQLSAWKDRLSKA